jgi:hypothetical protein
MSRKYSATPALHKSGHDCDAHSWHTFKPWPHICIALLLMTTACGSDHSPSVVVGSLAPKDGSFDEQSVGPVGGATS